MAFFVVCFGLILGSFANVLVFRLKAQEQFLWGSSYCPTCRKELQWFLNIPLLSFLFLKGRCSYCQKKISKQYPLVETLMMSLVFLLWLKIGEGFSFFDFSSVGDFKIFLPFIYLVVVTLILLVIAVYDAKWMEIPDGLIVIGALISFGYFLINFFWIKGGLDVWSFFSLLKNSLLGAFLLSGFFFLQYYFSKGLWVGFGDVKLGGWLGFMVGWKFIYPLILMAYILGALVAVGFLFKGKKKMKSQIAFGPFLVVATWIILVYQQEISHILLKLLY